jgi:hypothetical protein
LGFGAKPHLSEQLGMQPDIHFFNDESWQMFLAKAINRNRFFKVRGEIPNTWDDGVSQSN